MPVLLKYVGYNSAFNVNKADHDVELVIVVKQANVIIKAVSDDVKNINWNIAVHTKLRINVYFLPSFVYTNWDATIMPITPAAYYPEIVAYSVGLLLFIPA